MTRQGVLEVVARPAAPLCRQTPQGESIMTNANILKEVNRDIPDDIAARFKGDALFIAYGCLLLERDNGKSYTYKAVNLETGRSANLGRKVNPVTISGIPAMLKKIKASSIAGRGRFEADMRAGSNLFHDRLAEITQYIFSELLPAHGYGIREKQMELAGHILEAISRRGVSLAEAEVGTGKTHAYLIAAALAKRGRVNDFWLRGSYPGQSHAESAHMPVVVSTSSIALQNAIAKDYLPEISRILMVDGIISRPLTCVIRKGKEHYICEKKLHNHYRDADEQAKLVLRPLFSAASADLADAEGITPYTKRKICVSGTCAKNCAHYKDCRYQRHMKRAQSPEIDFQICNHNYFLADLLHRVQKKPPLIPHYQAVIIDEGHKFLDAARQMYGIQLENTAIPAITADVLSFTWREGESGAPMDTLAKKLARQSKELFKLLERNIPETEYDDDAERFKTVMDARATRHLRKIGQIAGELAAALSESRPLPKYRNRCKQAHRDLTRIVEQAEVLQDHGELVYWLEKPPIHRGGQEGQISLCAIPKMLNRMLHADLWSRKIPIILTSGTLSASGDFTHTKRTLGLDRLPDHRLTETTKPSPFNHRENALLYISESVPFPDIRDKAYIAAVAEETERLIRASHGHAAVLFTSYKAMDMVYELLAAKDLPVPLLRLDRGGAAAIDRFRESKNGVLFASGALWEGIDLPGDILSMLIIVKLPFAVPDPISEYERTLYDSMEEFKERVVTPGMIIKLKQGSGRLIRSEDDTGVIVLMDFRVRLGANYRDVVLDALPDYHVTSDILVVEAFIQLKKGPGYFM
jgi:ATP-dependent DNA helicase DinG